MTATVIVKFEIFYYNISLKKFTRKTNVEKDRCTSQVLVNSKLSLSIDCPNHWPFCASPESSDSKKLIN